VTDEEKEERDDLDEEGRDSESDDYDEEAKKKPAYSVDDDADDDGDEDAKASDADDDKASDDDAKASDDDDDKASDADDSDDDDSDDDAKASDDDDSDDDAKASDDDEKAASTQKRGKKKRRKKKAAKAAVAAAKPADDDDDDDDGDEDRRSPAASSSESSGGGGSMVPAIIGLVAGLGGGFLIGKSQGGGEGTVDASQDTAAAVSTATGTNGKGGPCQAYADALCEKLGATSPVCAQAKQASSFLSDKTCTTGISDIGATVAKLQSARKDCDKLVADLCKALGSDSQSCKLVTEKTPQFPAAQCTKMLENYDQVLKQLQQQEMKNKPLSAEQAKKLAAGDVPAYGPKDAKVTIVEFSDFECPYCARAAQTVDALKKAYPEGVRVVFRQFPLPMHKNAQIAAEASLAAHAQGKFWAMHDKLFENSRNLSRETIDKIAAEIGLDMAKFKKQLDDGAFKEAVEADKKLGGAIGVSGTPTMLVNTKRVQNPGDIKGIQKLVEEEGGPKAKEVAEEKEGEDEKKPEAPGAPKAPVPAAPKAPAPAAPKAPAPAAPKAPAPATP